MLAGSGGLKRETGWRFPFNLLLGGVTLIVVKQLGKQAADFICSQRFRRSGGKTNRAHIYGVGSLLKVLELFAEPTATSKKQLSACVGGSTS